MCRRQGLGPTCARHTYGPGTRRDVQRKRFAVGGKLACAWMHEELMCTRKHRLQDLGCPNDGTSNATMSLGATTSGNLALVP